MKGDTERKRYLERRAKVSTSLGKREVFSVADAWPLYAGTKNIRRYMYLTTLLSDIAEVPGDVAEFGCWRGATTAFFAKMLIGTNKVVHGFDTFQGFDAKIQRDKQLRSGYKGNRQELEAMLAVDDLTDAVELHVGDICNTVVDLAVQRSELRYAFAYVDCDVYAPCKAALDYIHPRLMQGGMIAFDEWGDPAWPGETQAADEFLLEYGAYYDIRATPVPQPSLVLVRK